MDGSRSTFLENSTHYYGNRSEIIINNTGFYEEFLVYYHHRTKLCAFVFGPMILLGLIGNVISFFNLAKLAHRNGVTFQLRVLAIIDFCLLLCLAFAVFTDKSASTYYVDGWLYTASDMLWPYRSAYVVPLASCFVLANSWTTVAIGMNRYIVVCRSLQAARLCTVSQAKKQLLCIILVVILFRLPSLVDCEVKKTTNGTLYLVNTLTDNKWYIYIYHIGCNVIFSFLIPFILLVFFCVRIITTLRAARRRPLGRHGDRLRDTKVTSMVLVLLGVFLVCNGLVWLNYSFHIVSNQNFHWRFVGNYVRFCSEMLITTNSSVNWLIYFMYIKAFRRMVCNGRSHRSDISRVTELT